MSQILNCGVNRDTLSILISMIENGANPEALAAVVKEMRKESISLNNSDIFVYVINVEKINVLQIFFS
jgi:hypothetical protein